LVSVFGEAATAVVCTLSLHDALPISWGVAVPLGIWAAVKKDSWVDRLCSMIAFVGLSVPDVLLALLALMLAAATGWFNASNASKDRKSTRLNSSHGSISYAVFCLKKK